MFSKILFTLEVVALIAAPVGYLKLRDYRAEQFFDKGNAALQAGDWGQAYAYYQEAARRDNDRTDRELPLAWGRVLRLPCGKQSANNESSRGGQTGPL